MPTRQSRATGAKCGSRCAWDCGRWRCCAPPLLVLLLFTRPMLLVFGQEPRWRRMRRLYVARWRFGLPFALGFQVLRSFSTALDRAPCRRMMVMVLAMLFNALGDYALIFGHFGLPRLGLLGAGMASACSNLFSFVAMLAVVPDGAGAAALSHPAPSARSRDWQHI